MIGFETKKWKKVAFKVIDFRSFLTYIWRGSIKHEFPLILYK